MNTPNNQQIDELLNLPGTFHIKIMGFNDPELINEVSAIISVHVNNFNPEGDISVKPSSKGNYVALTATIWAESKAQLDEIYSALNKHSLVKMTL